MFKKNNQKTPKNKNDDFATSMQQSVPLDVQEINSDFELDFKDLIIANNGPNNSTNNPNIKTILISGNASTGKTEIIKKAKLKLDDEDPKYSSNVTYINCKNFLDTINEQKEDYFSLFIARISNKIKGKEKTVIEKNEINMKFVWISSLISVLSFIAPLIILNNVSFDKWWNILIYSIWVIFWIVLIAAFIIFIFKTYNNSKRWSNYQAFFQKLFKKVKNNSIIIFDEMNRLIVPSNSNLIDVEKKFIKEITSLSINNVIFIFVTSGEFIDKANDREQGFLFSYFNKIYKVITDNEIVLKILNASQNFKSLKYNTKSIILKMLIQFDYRTTVFFVQKIKNINDFISQNNHLKIDEQYIFFFALIKSFMFHKKEWNILNTKMQFQDHYLLKDDFAQISYYFSDISVNFSITSIEQIIKNYKLDKQKQLKEADPFFGITITGIFENQHLQDLIEKYINENAYYLSKQILNTYHFLYSTTRHIYTMLMPTKKNNPNDLYFDLANWFVLKNTFFQYCIYNYDIFQEIIKSEDIDKLLVFRDYEYWIEVWVVYSLQYSNLSSNWLKITQQYTESIKSSDQMLMKFVRHKINYDFSQIIGESVSKDDFISLLNGNKDEIKNPCVLAEEVIHNNPKIFQGYTEDKCFIVMLYIGNQDFIFDFNWEMTFCKNWEQNRKNKFDLIYKYLPKEKALNLILHRIDESILSRKNVDWTTKFKEYRSFVISKFEK